MIINMVNSDKLNNNKLNNNLYNGEFNINNKFFIITASPNEKNINTYIDFLKNKNIELVIKVTNNTLYDLKIYEKSSIKLKELIFDDGSVPSDSIILELMNLIKNYNKICIHCVAGLGRAPLLMCLILILEFDYNRTDALIEIRKKIPYALNTIQVEFISDLKINKYKKSKKICNIL
jgi:protein tyrosine phosphatase type 4A